MGISGWSVRRRLGAFVVGLVAVFGAGYGLGAAVGPADETEPAPHAPADPHAPMAPSTTVDPHPGDHS